MEFGQHDAVFRIDSVAAGDTIVHYVVTQLSIGRADTVIGLFDTLADAEAKVKKLGARDWQFVSYWKNGVREI